VKVKPVIAWYDLWVGIYWDRQKRRLYILPMPCVGVMVQFKAPALPVRKRSVVISEYRWRSGSTFYAVDVIDGRHFHSDGQWRRGTQSPSGEWLGYFKTREEIVKLLGDNYEIIHD
jgi:hypothetical protein